MGRRREPETVSRRERAIAALAGTPLAPTRLKRAAMAVTTYDAREAAIAAGLPAAEGERALFRRRTRRVEHSLNADPLASRAQGGMALDYAWNRLSDAYLKASYRVATHHHETELRFGLHAGVTSDGGSEWASKSGLSRAYQKKSARVATSKHQITAASTWMRRVYLRGAALVDCRLVLSLDEAPDPGGAYRASWVEPGRGTAIRLATGWIAQKANGAWAFARKRRAA